MCLVKTLSWALTYWGFSWFFSVNSDNCCDSALNFIITASIQILSNSFFTSFIMHHSVCQSVLCWAMHEMISNFWYQNIWIQQNFSANNKWLARRCIYFNTYFTKKCKSSKVVERPQLGKSIYIQLGLLNDAFNCEDYTVLSDRTIREILRLWNQSEVHVWCISLIGTL